MIELKNTIEKIKRCTVSLLLFLTMPLYLILFLKLWKTALIKLEYLFSIGKDSLFFDSDIKIHDGARELYRESLQVDPGTRWKDKCWVKGSVKFHSETDLIEG